MGILAGLILMTFFGVGFTAVRLVTDAGGSWVFLRGLWVVTIRVHIRFHFLFHLRFHWTSLVGLLALIALLVAVACTRLGPS